jgi:hypothetical protein
MSKNEETCYMPTIHRSMKRATDGLPVVGSNSKELGVRVPPNPDPDIDLDPSDFVILNDKGMSVAANWRNFLAHLIPKRLKPLLPGAAGGNSLTCYKTGTGPFAAGAVSTDLNLVVKQGNNQRGNVVPAQVIHRDQFQADLAATRAQWSQDET